MDAKGKARALLPVNTLRLLLLLAVFFILQVPLALGDTADYFYDDLGRLSRVVKGASGVVYGYDALGNLLSVTSATTTNGSPVLTGVNPNVLFVGSKMRVTITGQNLLTTEAVTVNGGLVIVENVKVIDNTRISAEMTALSAGSDTIRVTTRYGSPNFVETSITLSSSELAFSPSQLALAPGSSGTITASVSPPLAVPVTISLESSATSVATVPASVTIPVSGSASFIVNALQNGVANITGGGPKCVVFVGPSFSGDVSGLKSESISVRIDAQAGTSPTITNPISVYLDAPAGASPIASPISVSIDAPAGESPTISGSVSVKIQ